MEDCCKKIEKKYQKYIREYYHAMHAFGAADNPDQELYDRFMIMDRLLQKMSKYKRKHVSKR